MKFEFVETPRLRLRLITPEVYRHVFTQLTEPEQDAFFGFGEAAQMQRERERFKAGTEMFEKSFLFAVMLDRETEKVIGWCGYHTWYVRHARAELGYTTYDPSHRNKGLMSEALEAMIRYGFTRMLLHRIEAFIGKDNEPSLRLMARFNFQPEGCLREHYFTDNRYEDSLVYSLLRHEAGYGKPMHE